MEFLNGIFKKNQNNTDFVDAATEHKERKYDEKIFFGTSNVRGSSYAMKSFEILKVQS